MSKTILITGATGKQGGATIRALLETNANIEILAVTRNPDSTSAQKLTQVSPKIKLVKGDLTDTDAIFSNATKATSNPIWGVFSVQANVASASASPQTIRTQTLNDISKKLDPEELSGISLIDSALRANVKFFVYTSVDRHGDRSSTNPTPVPHFISKHTIEQYLFRACENSSMNYTVLRPTAFMENALGTFGIMFGTLWSTRPADMKLQLIATSDIGYFAAQAFLYADSATYRNRCISLAGDELTWTEAQRIFRETAGKEFPTTFWILGQALLWAVADVRLMFQWFQDEGYGADVEALRKIHPGLKDLGTWVREESGFVER